MAEGIAHGGDGQAWGTHGWLKGGVGIARAVEGRTVGHAHGGDGRRGARTGG